MTSRVCPRCEGAHDERVLVCPRCRAGGGEVHLVSPAVLRATPQSARYLLGCVVDRRFRVDGYLGGGGMSVVYRATQISVDRPVALKIIRSSIMNLPGIEGRFEREAKVLAQLSHPNIAQVYDFGAAELGEPHPVLYIAMELVSGVTLGAAIAEGTLAMDQLEGVADQILAGLDAAHRRGVVHRDLKPENVMIESDGRARLLDFGIAKITADGGNKLTATGMNPGTPAYMPPEQWLGGEIGPWTDLYAFGCIAFEMLTGRVPFTATTPVALAPLHVDGAIPEPTRADGALIPPALAALSRRCLAKRPADRPESAEAAREALRRGDRSPPRPPDLLGAGLAPRRWPWALGLLGAGLVVAGLLWWDGGVDRLAPSPSIRVAVRPSSPDAGRAALLDAALLDAAPPDAAVGDATTRDTGGAADLVLADAAPRPSPAAARRPRRRPPPARPPAVAAPPLKVEEL